MKTVFWASLLFGQSILGFCPENLGTTQRKTWPRSPKYPTENFTPNVFALIALKDKNEWVR